MAIDRSSQNWADGLVEVGETYRFENGTIPKQEPEQTEYTFENGSKFVGDGTGGRL